MKKKYRSIFALLGTSFLLFGCKENNPDIYHYSDSISVKRVNGLSDDFICGMDISSIVSLEESGVKFYNFEGKEEDIFSVIKKSGTTHVRIRVWNDPTDGLRTYGGGNCDLNTCLAIARRCKNVGLKLIIDFHYSDFWADPGKQAAPKAWKNLDIDSKVNALSSFTLSSLKKLKEIGSDVTMVQMGNEINNALCGETEYENISKLLKASYDAIKSVYPNSLTAIHYTDPQKKEEFLWRLDKLQSNNVNYDVIGISYYPFWHGDLSSLKNTLSEVSNKYNKKVAVLETSYPFTLEDTDFHENTICEKTTQISTPYPFSIQGQANEVRDVVNIVNSIKNGIGVCYWEPAWISVGDSLEENQYLWETYGSGWATSFAGDYDSSAKEFYGGSAVDNQALFDSKGFPLESLKIFNLIR